jgi:hypothetical protein
MDPLSFPALATAAFGQAFGFLFGRLAHLLDRRERAKGDPDDDAVEAPDALEGHLNPLVPDNALVEQYIEELERLSGALGVYHRNPDRLDPQDGALRTRLGRLRELLEIIYGQHITFHGEAREPSGVAVEQRVDTVSGAVTGVRGRQVSRARVAQDVRHVDDGGWVIGVQADEIG